MAVLSMRRYGDPILRLLAAPVAAVTPEIKTLIADMAETMWHQVGIGLAAPQIGVSLRIFVMDDGKRGARAIDQPGRHRARGRRQEEEGCLSLPGIFAEVERSKSLRIEALDGEGQPISFEAQGFRPRSSSTSSTISTACSSSTGCRP